MEPQQRNASRTGPLPDADHLAASRSDDPVIARVLSLVRHLRAHCPWDARQTPRSLVPFLLEEADEVADAILAGADRELPGELGDLLLNVAFQIVLAEERGAFDASDVVEMLERKMTHRHPHVYGDREEPPDWEQLKGPTGDRSGDGPRPEPRPGPLARARRVQARAARSGFDWPHASDSLEKVVEEIKELEELLGRGQEVRGEPVRGEGEDARGEDARGEEVRGQDARGEDARPERRREAVAEEVGDLLFAAVNVARLAGVDPDEALLAASDKFRHRFRRLARLAEARGMDTTEASLEELEALWREVKGR